MKATATVRVNTQPPTIASTSHPNERTWGGSNALFFSWTNPQADANFTGSYFTLDRFADTVPAATPSPCTPRARVAGGEEHHEGAAGEVQVEQLEPHCLWAPCTEVARARPSALGRGWRRVGVSMKRAVAMVVVMLAAVASAAVVDVERAPSREGEGGKTQWAPTRSFRGLNARAVFAGESRRAASPYAGEASETAAGGKEAGFTGHRFETTLGLTYAEQRWLDSSTGTWLSRDPVGASSYLARPNELYAFGYAAGNPARFSDPSGRFVFDKNTGYFEVENGDSTTRLELLVGFLQMKDTDGALGFNQHLAKFMAVRETTALLGVAYDDDALYRVHLVSLLQGYFQDPATASARFDNRTRLQLQMAYLNGLSAADEGAEATATVAGILGAPTSKGDVAVMMAIPVAAGVVKFGAKKGIKLLRHVLGRGTDDAARALSRIDGVQFRPSHGSEGWGPGLTKREVGFTPSTNELLNAERTASRRIAARARPGSIADLSGNGYLATISPEGYVSTSLYAAEMTALVDGPEAMLRIMEHFGQNVKGLRGLWSGRGTNIDELNRLTELGQSIEEAAWKTWTGQQARAFGFTRVRLEAPPLGDPGRYTRVNVVFE